MAFTPEDGSGVVGANSYASVEDLESFAEFRLDLTGYTDPQKQAALVVASCDWVDGQHTFRGESLKATQGLDFPLVGIGFPADIKAAAMYAALLQLQGLLLVDLAGLDDSGEVQSVSKTLGPMTTSTTYKTGSTQTYSRILPKYLTSLLKPYLDGNGQMVRRL